MRVPKFKIGEQALLEGGKYILHRHIGDQSKVQSIPATRVTIVQSEWREGEDMFVYLVDNDPSCRYGWYQEPVLHKIPPLSNQSFDQIIKSLDQPQKEPA